MSGYFAIALGRSRGTEDIDILFGGDWKCIDSRLSQSDFYCINGPSVKGLVSENVVPRIARKGEWIPNIELKPVNGRAERFAIENPLVFKIREAELNMSPIELQIAYKLYPGSEKDYEDAIFIYETLKEHVNPGDVLKWLDALGVRNGAEKIREVLGEIP